MQPSFVVVEKIKSLSGSYFWERQPTLIWNVVIMLGRPTTEHQQLMSKTARLP